MRDSTVNWHNLCNGKAPAVAIEEYFRGIFLQDEDSAAAEEAERSRWMGVWHSLRIDLLPHKVTPVRLMAAMKKLKNGKGSSDGCTAEMYKQLPASAVESLACFYTTIMASLLFPDSWTVILAVLIPKLIGAHCLDKFRPIASLPVARKLLGYLWMQMLPALRYESFRCGFVPRSHGAQGVYVIKRAMELSKEWKGPIFCVQLDLRRAFDRVKHSAVFAALRLQGVSLQCLAVLSAMLDGSYMSAKLGRVTAQKVKMQRGLPQGAPESPLLFTLVTEMVLRPLLSSWASQGAGWKMDNLWLPAVCYADDVLLLSSSLDGLEAMLSEVVSAFAAVGLDVGPDKSHWTSYPALPTKRLRCPGGLLRWEDRLTFIGTVLDFNGNDDLAMEHRTAQATKVFYKWQKVLQCPHVSLRARVHLLAATVFAAVPWLAETWHPTARQTSRLESWAARLAARVACMRPHAAEDPGDFWRRMHRDGHCLMLVDGGGVDFRRRCRLHSFAGHLARSNAGRLNEALRSRGLAW